MNSNVPITAVISVLTAEENLKKIHVHVRVYQRRKQCWSQEWPYYTSSAFFGNNRKCCTLVKYLRWFWKKNRLCLEHQRIERESNFEIILQCAIVHISISFKKTTTDQQQILANFLIIFLFFTSYNVCVRGRSKVSYSTVDRSMYFKGSQSSPIYLFLMSVYAI